MGREAGPGRKAASRGSAWTAYTAAAEKAVEMEEPVRVEGIVYSIQKARCSGWVGRDCGAHERSQRSGENVACLGLHWVWPHLVVQHAPVAIRWGYHKYRDYLICSVLGQLSPWWFC